MTTRQPTNQEIYHSIKKRAEFYKDKDDYLGIFTVAQVLWLLEEIDRKDRVIESLSELNDEWSFQSCSGEVKD
ncbi:MAG: hypothetical protein H7836_04305 [Magnetococcus sp. YQC-3]